MGLLSNIRGAVDSARAEKVRKANEAAASGGSGGKKKGRHRKETPVCGRQWEDRGRPGSKNATYPHKDHICGQAPHNRGMCLCRRWDCSATSPYPTKR